MPMSPLDGVRGATARLIRTADIEVIPLKGAEEKIRVVPAGATVTITCSPKFGLERTLEHSARAAQRGYRVVPHLRSAPPPSRSWYGCEPCYATASTGSGRSLPRPAGGLPGAGPGR